MKFVKNSSPHNRGLNTSSKLMLNVIIAMIPVLIASVIFFGIKALVVIGVSVASSVAFEFIWNLIFRKKQTVGDLTAVITGMLLAFNLPSSIPLYLVVLGAFIAIIIAKQLFGGLGKNILNPALVGRVALLFLFEKDMSRWTMPGFNIDALASATPLITTDEPIKNLIIGNISGSLGETSAIAILIGFAVLLITKTIKPYIPLAFIGSVMVFSLALGKNPLYSVLAGGVLLGAVFMATDYTTSSYTVPSSLLFGIGGGFLTVMIRQFTKYPEGVSIAILLMNIAVIFLNKISIPEQFGAKLKFKTDRMIRTTLYSLFAVAAVGLGVFTFIKSTKTIIYAQPEAVSAFLGETYETVEDTGNEDILEHYTNADGNHVIVAKKRGFDDNIVLVLYLDKDLNITNIEEGQNLDHVGILAIERDDFYSSFDGKNTTQGIVAVAGATVTTQAVIDIITEALAYLAAAA